MTVWRNIASRYKKGTIQTGRVIKVLEYACYVEIEKGILGLLHLKDMAWITSNLKPSDLVSCKDTIEVMILNVDEDKQLISLGLKQCKNNPWKGISTRYPEGKRVKGLVSKVIDYGCIVHIDKDIEGLVQVSDMHWTDRNMHPSKIVTVGDAIEVMVLDVQEEKYRISLGIKQCQPNPWEQFAEKYQLNDHITGIVDSFTHFGIILKLEGDLSALVHTSDLPEESEQLEKGEPLKVRIVSIDTERERIGLKAN
ncbi:S1 RNA-binding domain-containing protein [Labilibaculum sp.]|uniref:S1 RNA-binding domain-containing protein n=1 Tax=Labilibaculum sp. TaxID=2060723 RepID=UPI0035651B88